MIGKNNLLKKQQKQGTRVETYSIKKFKVGAASVLVNLAMIPWLGYIGASITSVVVEFLVFAIQWFYSRNIINKNLLFNTELLKIIVAAVAMFIVIEVAKIGLGLSGLIGLIVYVALGGAIYLVILLILKAINIREIKATLKH